MTFPALTERRRLGRLYGRWVAIFCQAALVCVVFEPAGGVLGAGSSRPLEAASMLDEAPGGRIPSVDGLTLAGEQVRLPGDLASRAGAPESGRTAVLIVGFGREASGAARDWGLRLGTDLAGSQSTVYYELPMLAGVPRLLRGVVLRTMSGSVSERGRHHFLPVTEDEAAWRRVVEFHGDTVPYLLVVDDQGVIRWRVSGAFSEPLYAQLREHLPAASH